MGLVTSPFSFLLAFPPSFTFMFIVSFILYTFPVPSSPKKKKGGSGKAKTVGVALSHNKLIYIPRLQIITSGIGSIEIETG